MNSNKGDGSEIRKKGRIIYLEERRKEIRGQAASIKKHPTSYGALRSNALENDIDMLYLEIQEGFRPAEEKSLMRRFGVYDNALIAYRRKKRLLDFIYKPLE